MSAKPVLTTHKDVDFDPEIFISTYYSSVAGHEEDREYVKFFLDGLSDAFKSSSSYFFLLFTRNHNNAKPSQMSGGAHKITLTDRQTKHLNDAMKNKKGVQIIFLKAAIADMIKSGGIFPLSSVEKRQDELKRKIQNIVKCDVTQPNPVFSTPVDGVVFDAITSSLCLETASVTLDEYAKSVQNISSLLKPGGHLVLVGVLDETFYTVGEFRFKSTCIGKDQLQDIWQKEGFKILSLKDFNDTCFSLKRGSDLSDFQNAFVMVAKKIEG
ncbi:hypothetical protein ACJMK2_039355 [Sinanodonta woodiana]|uniref:Methyltransferase type 11 domain-containing protein n=1 Tax=Sinanodonta woodiana TaxID=1069815 RepID=A0ABD3WF38_SINWO